MLYLISLGIADEMDMSLKALETARRCEKLYAEFYTTVMNTTAKKLEKVFGKKIKPLKRGDLEEDSDKIILEAKKMDIGILVGGDALAATTHVTLLLECRKKGVDYEVVHGSSVFTAVGECGLSLYKFGETVSVPRWTANYTPSGFYETILKNKKIGLHTLILLDIGMRVQEGVEILLRIEKQRKKRLFQSNKIVSISRLGTAEQRIRYETVQKLLLNEEKPAVFIIPGRLNAVEREFLETL